MEGSMSQAATESKRGNGAQKTASFDAVVIGAGVAGLYQLHRLREQGLNVRVIDAASGVGGTWYWNRYPGARFDSEAYIYQYLFSEQLYKGWSCRPSEGLHPHTAIHHPDEKSQVYCR
jgi:acetone monooxygenase (methyl acetate-forming)